MLFNVADYAQGFDQIKPYMHTLEGRLPETLEGQRRLLRKWHHERDTLFANTRLDHEAMRAKQLSSISMIVDYAYSTHPFYHELYRTAGFKRGDIVSWEDYNTLPTIQKSDIIDNYDLFTSNIAPLPSECSSPRTSGSSGRSVQVLRDSVMTDQNILRRMRFFEQMIGRIRQPNEWLYMVYIDCLPYTSLDGNFPTFTISNDCPPELALEHIKHLKPTVLSGFSTYFNRLIGLPDDLRNLGIQAITTNSESSTPVEREMIAQRFDAPVFDEYSSVEMGLLATECHDHRYHLVEDNVRVDVLTPDKNGVGEIVATNLVNTYWPMIRYRQGDPIKIADHFSQCTCGNKFRHLDMFVGRADQFLQSRITGIVPPDRIMSLYDRLLLPPEAKIDEFRIIQIKPDEVQLLLVPMAGHAHADHNTLNEFVRGLKDLFADPGLNVVVQELAAMPTLPSHKRRLIENRIK